MAFGRIRLFPEAVALFRHPAIIQTTSDFPRRTSSGKCNLAAKYNSILAHSPLFVLTACFILAFHGETMKYAWSWFLAAAWLAARYQPSRGVSVVRVFAVQGLIGAIAWQELSLNRAPSAQQRAAA
jgi:hypothetical protein